MKPLLEGIQEHNDPAASEEGKPVFLHFLCTWKKKKSASFISMPMEV